MLATVARYCVTLRPSLNRYGPARQLMNQGLRKLHDRAVSFRGKGKYLGHAHWSVDALKLLKVNGNTVQGIKNKLSHEHVVPAMTVVRILFDNDPTAPTLRYERQIRKFSVVAIITRDEENVLSRAGLARKMPDDWDGRDVWARYRKTGLVKKIRPRPPDSKPR